MKSQSEVHQGARDDNRSAPLGFERSVHRGTTLAFFVPWPQPEIHPNSYNRSRRASGVGRGRSARLPSRWLLLVAIFDWNWFRGPLERYLRESTGRPVTIGYLDVDLALQPRIIISDIAIGNAEWAGDKPLVILRELMLSVRVPSLFTNKIVLPHVRLTGGDVTLVRDKDGRANWQLRKSDEPSTRTFDVQSLALIDASLSFRDAIQNIDVKRAASPAGRTV